MPVPNIYEDGAAVHGTGALSVPWGTHNAQFHAIILITSAGQTILPPTSSDTTWTLIAEAYEGTPGAAGSIGIAAYWAPSTDDGGMTNVTVPDTGDHTSAKMWMLQNVLPAGTGNPINMSATQTVSVATASISMAAPPTTVANCLVMMAAGHAIDTAVSPGGSGWTNAALDSIGFNGQFTTTNGVGGGYMGAQGEKAAAGSCGTFTHTWAGGATKQANLIWAISDTATVGGGDPEIEGTQASTLAAMTSTAAGHVEAHGAQASTLAAMTGAATGTVPAHGAQASTLGTLTSTATAAARVAGAQASTLADLAATSAGTVAAAATVAATLGDATGAATGEVDVTGAQAATLGNLVGSATGAVPAHGAQASTLEDLATSATGGSADPTITGTQASTLADATAAGEGEVSVSGVVASTLGDAVHFAEGSVPIRAAQASTLADATSSATGAVAIVGQQASTLADLTSTAVASDGVPQDPDTVATLIDLVPTSRVVYPEYTFELTINGAPMTTPVPRDIRRTRGDTYTFEVEVALAGVVQDLSGCTYELAVYGEATSDTALVTMAGDVDAPLTGIVAFTPTEEDAALARGTYHYRLRQTDGALQVRTMLTGKWLVT